MKRDFDLYIYNDLTNDVQIIHKFNLFLKNSNDTFSFLVLYTYLEEFIKKQIPFRVEFVFNK